MADFPGKVIGAVGDAAKGIGKSVVDEVKRVPQEIASDVIEEVTGGAIDIGEKKSSELTPEEIQARDQKRRQDSARLAEVQGQLQQVAQEARQREAQRVQQQVAVEQQSHHEEQQKKKSLKDRVIGMFTKRASSKGEMEKGKK